MVLGRDLVIYGSPNSSVYYQVIGSGDQQQLVVQWNEVGFYAYPSGNPITFQVILTEADNSIQYNYLDLQTDYYDTSEGRYASVGYYSYNYTTGSYISWYLDTYNVPNAFVGTGRSTRVANLPASADYYSFQLDAGQTASIGLASLYGYSGLTLRIEDAAGNVLVEGFTGTPGFDLAITSFVAGVSDSYYAVVTGSGFIDYNLVVTRDAELPGVSPASVIDATIEKIDQESVETVVSRFAVSTTTAELAGLARLAKPEAFSFDSASGLKKTRGEPGVSNIATATDFAISKRSPTSVLGEATSLGAYDLAILQYGDRKENLINLLATDRVQSKRKGLRSNR